MRELLFFAAISWFLAIRSLRCAFPGQTHLRFGPRRAGPADSGHTVPIMASAAGQSSGSRSPEAAQSAARSSPARGLKPCRSDFHAAERAFLAQRLLHDHCNPLHRQAVESFSQKEQQEERLLLVPLGFWVMKIPTFSDTIPDFTSRTETSRHALTNTLNPPWI